MRGYLCRPNQICLAQTGQLDHFQIVTALPGFALNLLTLVAPTNLLALVVVAAISLLALGLATSPVEHLLRLLEC